MVIQHLGGYCFKLSAGPVTVAVNPPSQRSRAHKLSKFGADVVLVSVPDDDWNGVETATHGDKEPFVIQGPGSYEVGDISVSGYATPASYGDVLSDVGNTIYVVGMDGMRILILGALSNPKLPAEIRSELDGIGIVLVPIGDGTLDAKSAHELVTGIEPNAIIPYAVKDEKAVAAFLKAEGETGLKPVEKLTVRAKELAAMDGAVVLLG
jgi:L-ascorbate metabolism protein UlaG (beta-lactamase superfamily)